MESWRGREVENLVKSVAPSLRRGPGRVRSQALILSRGFRTVPRRALARARVLSLGVILATTLPWAPGDAAAAAGAGGDHLHPGDDGYKLLAGAIDLALFK